MTNWEREKLLKYFKSTLHVFGTQKNGIFFNITIKSAYSSSKKIHIQSFNIMDNILRQIEKVYKR